jgi:putative nucleotidyltransferase with HDIG domain
MLAGLPTRAKAFVSLVCATGTVCLAVGMVPWHSSGERLLFASYFALTTIASALNAELPGIKRDLKGTVSVNFVFFLLGVCTMTLSETLSLALVATLVQCFWRKKPLHFVHFAFNLSQVSVAITASYWTYNLLLSRLLHGHSPLALLVAAVIFFLLNSMQLATIVALTDGTSIPKKWLSYSWTFPYYLMGGVIAAIVQIANRFAGWEMSILVLPGVYAVYRAFRMRLGRWEDENRHLQELASLNMRTIETLALAIEAKDHTTGDHLQRVRVYAMEMAKDLGLSPAESEALKAASVLHDIGKLAVPEHIISKPGKLTPEEFEKMKVHPIVGAEILEQVRFPYPVAPIVRSHHEKWDGTGYPDGLSGEAIPIGARILSAVDCLDALASDRQYRRALPLDEAMAHVEREAGKAFDPRVVAVLKARYVALEEMARAHEPGARPRLSTDIKVQRGAAPDAGFGVSISATASADTQPAAGILDNLTRSRARPLTLLEILSTAAVRIGHRVPYDAMAAYACAGSILTPCFVLGENARELGALRIRRGQGLAGWVAETANCIVNGNPTVEPGFMEDAQQPAVLRSALAVPIVDGKRIVGVLALYRILADTFTAEHLSVLQPLGEQLGPVVTSWLESGELSGRTGAGPQQDLEQGVLATGGRTSRPI